MIFPIAGNNGKYIKIYDIEKKNFSAKPFLGYCPIYIVKNFFFLLQGKALYRDITAGLGVKWLWSYIAIQNFVL